MHPCASVHLKATWTLERRGKAGWWAQVDWKRWIGAGFWSLHP